MALRTAMSQGRTATGSELRFSFWLKATLVESEGPAMINREWGKHRVTLQCNVRGREVASFVGEAQKEIAQQVNYPPNLSDPDLAGYWTFGEAVNSQQGAAFLFPCRW